MHALALTFFVTLAAPSAPPTSTTPTAPAKDPAKAPAKDPATPTSTMATVSDKNYAEKVLAPRKGKVVVVNFWASYCLPCLKEIPDLQALAAAHAKDVDVVFISSDPPSQGAHAMAALKSKGITVESSIVENEDPEPFIKMIDDVWGGEMPFTVIYDRAGKPVQKLAGGHSKAEFELAIQAALAAPAKK